MDAQCGIYSPTGGNQSEETKLQWVIRKTHNLEHRSVPEFLGIDSDEPGFIYSKDEFSAVELLNRFPVDVIIDFSSENGIDYYGEEVVKHGVAIVSAISSYSADRIELLGKLALNARVLWSPNITIGINFLIIAAKILKKNCPVH